jgi:hypothetical protein
MVGQGEFLGSPWPHLAIHPCSNESRKIQDKSKFWKLVGGDDGRGGEGGVAMDSGVDGGGIKGRGRPWILETSTTSYYFKIGCNWM